MEKFLIQDLNTGNYYAGMNYLRSIRPKPYFSKPDIIKPYEYSKKEDALNMVKELRKTYSDYLDGIRLVIVPIFEV